MEIEAKYTLAGASALAAIAGLRALGPYRLEPAPAPEGQRNTYFDTADMRLAARRAGLRVRELEGRRIATVKTAGQVRDGLHERGEWEVELGPEAGGARPEQWPESEARTLAIELTGGAALLPIVRVRTLRRNLYVFRGEALAAELSLDDGAIEAGGRELPFCELEIELRPGGYRADLAALAELLGRHTALAPEDRSKLARGLELLGAGATSAKEPTMSEIPVASPGAPPAPDPSAAPPDPLCAPVALALFDRTDEAHEMPRAARRLLHLAAAAYDSARVAGAENPARTARDALLAAPIDGLARAEQAVAAGAVALLAGGMRREPALLALGKGERRRAVQLGGLLRVAEALAAAGGSAAVAVADGATQLAVGGEEAARAVDERGKLWRRAIGGLAVRAAAPEDAAQPEALDGAPEEGWAAPQIAPAGLRGGEGAAEGARRVLRRFFERMLGRERAVRSGEDVEDVHQMRVATRRLRASLQVAEGLIDVKVTRRYRRRLRRTAAALGAVRDKDVFLAGVLAHRDTLPEDERGLLDRLLDAVRAERAQAREQLEEALASGRHRRFKRAFAAFLTTPGAGATPAGPAGPPRVRDVAGSAIWRRFEELRAFEVALPDAPDATLHAARIVGKRLRYTLELFADALGPGADDALAPLVALQEALGALQDTVVAREHVRALGLEEDRGAQGYLAALDAAWARHAEALPQVWEQATGVTYRRRLLELIGNL